MSKRSRKQNSKSTQIKQIIIGPVGLAVLMAGIIGGLWYRNRPEPIVFEPNTTVGETALAAVKTSPDKGREHLEPGQVVNYDSDFPTSGAHDPEPIMPGFYTEEQMPTKLVHSLEHGNIVIYYDEAQAETLNILQGWTREFPGAWDGVVVVPKAGLSDNIVLTAWTKQLVLPEFDPKAAASFVDEFRGRGPENPVR